MLIRGDHPSSALFYYSGRYRSRPVRDWFPSSRRSIHTKILPRGKSPDLGSYLGYLPRFFYAHVTNLLRFQGQMGYFLTGNHKNIFNDAGVPWSEYRYYDPRTVGLDFDGMIADIKVALS